MLLSVDDIPDFREFGFIKLLLCLVGDLGYVRGASLLDALDAARPGPVYTIRSGALLLRRVMPRLYGWLSHPRRALGIIVQYCSATHLQRHC